MDVTVVYVCVCVAQHREEVYDVPFVYFWGFGFDD